MDCDLVPRRVASTIALVADAIPDGEARARTYGRRMSPQTPLDVVIAGGGIAALEATMALRDLAEDRVKITLVAPERDFELKALRTAEPFSRDHVPHYPLSEIAARFDAELRVGAVAEVDAARHVARLTDGTELAYDALVLAVGARARAAYEHVLTFGGDSRTEILNALLADLEEHYTRSVAFVVPPGVGWPLPPYELALMTAQQVHGMGIDDARFEFVTKMGGVGQIAIMSNGEVKTEGRVSDLVDRYRCNLEQIFLNVIDSKIAA